jgi:energy-coupling factor transport system ATP-binding protein
VIRVEHLTHIYNKGLAYETKAIDDVSFAVDQGSFVGIIGHTGSGKSTLIQHLNGILRPDSGRIFLDEVEITAKKVKMAEIRKRVGLVFQYPEYQLFEETVEADVAFGPKNLGLHADEISMRVREALQMVNLDYEAFIGRSPFELSGGQKRRVAIAGVIAMRPEILILDEPTAGLDPKSHDDILNMVRDIRLRTGCIIFLVSHNMGDIAEMADRVLVMDQGRLILNGPPEEIFAEEVRLREIGLGLPSATRMAMALEAGGVRASGKPILTLDGLADYVAENLKKRSVQPEEVLDRGVFSNAAESLKGKSVQSEEVLDRGVSSNATESLGEKSVQPECDPGASPGGEDFGSGNGGAHS